MHQCRRESIPSSSVQRPPAPVTPRGRRGGDAPVSQREESKQLHPAPASPRYPRYPRRRRGGDTGRKSKPHPHGPASSPPPGGRGAGAAPGSSKKRVQPRDRPAPGPARGEEPARGQGHRRRNPSGESGGRPTPISPAEGVDSKPLPAASLVPALKESKPCAATGLAAQSSLAPSCRPQ